jgi:hypothetical protein
VSVLESVLESVRDWPRSSWINRSESVRTSAVSAHQHEPHSIGSRVHPHGLKTFADAVEIGGIPRQTRADGCNG